MVTQPDRDRTGDFTTILVKVILLGLVNALTLWALPILLSDRQYGPLAVLLLGVLAADYVFLSRRAYPLRFLLPGFAFLALTVVYPLGYTVYVAFTNFSTGHILTKQMAINQYLDRYIVQEGLPAYRPEYFRNKAGAFAVLLTDLNGGHFVGYDGKACSLAESALKPMDSDGDGIYDRLGDFARLGTLQILPLLSRLQNLTFTYRGVALRMRRPEEFASYIPQYHYDARRDALVDQASGKVYHAKAGRFISLDGASLDIGYKTTVGWLNFKNLLTDRRIADPFLRVFSWTVAWATLSVAGTFTLGLLLAVLLNDPRLRLRGFYRVLLVVPYAFPTFISALIWRGLFNTEFGQINALLAPILGHGIPWLQDPMWAKAALLIVNLWLSFPYMMLITLGALQSIPEDLYEAATVDGAIGWQQFSRITLPLLLIILLPLLIASFAFNFNNFNVIYLVTEGRPAIPGALTPTGATDILISYTYRMAFEGGVGSKNYGLAAAVSLLIFLIVGIITWINFRFAGAFKEAHDR